MIVAGEEKRAPSGDQIPVRNLGSAEVLLHSIVLVELANIVGRFRWFCSGCSGSRADAGALQATTFYKLAREGLSNPVCRSMVASVYTRSLEIGK